MDACKYPKEVSLFEKPCNSIAYQKIQYVDFRPTSQLSSGGPLTFTIPSTGSQYVNLKKTYLHLKVKLVNGDGSDIQDKEIKLAPINNILHSLFDQVDVQLQHQLVSTGQNYCYKAYIENLLEYGSEAKESQLQAQGFFKDKAGFFDSEISAHANMMDDGKFWRWMMFAGSQSNELIGPLSADICQQDRLILDNVDIQVRLWPSKDVYRVFTHVENPSYKMEITDAVLKVCKITPTPTLLIGHSNALKDNHALYPYQKTQIRTFNIPSGQLNFLLDDLYQGQVPSRLVVAMVKSKAFNGDYNFNPYNATSSHLSSLGVYVNDESIPGKPLQIQADACTSAYYNMFTALNRDGQDWGNDIKSVEFPLGNAWFVFDLLPGDQPALHKANLKIEANFREALSENMTVIVYGKFPAMMEITETRSVLVTNP